MPIAFSCSCGRKINAKDEHAGKKAKCPACGQVVTVPSPAKASASAGAAAARPKAAPKPAPVDDEYDVKEDAPPPKKRSASAVADASPWGDDDPGLAAPVAPRSYSPTSGGAAPAAKGKKGAAAPAGTPQASAASAFGAVGSRKRGEPAPTGKAAKLAGGFHLGGFAKFIIGAAILIPTTFFIIRQGPVKAVAEWDKAEVDGENDIRSTLMRVIHDMDAATMPPPDPNEKLDGIPYHPEVEHFFFVDPPTLMWRMPDSIEFEGRTTFGDYKGVYWTRKREVKCDMDWKGSDKLKVESKCDATGNVQTVTVDGIPTNDRAAISKKFGG
jgi:hypothetical protein